VGTCISGQISRLAHYRYALSFSEIQADVNAGPSSQVDMPTDQGAELSSKTHSLIPGTPLDSRSDNPDFVKTSLS
jgi:hypothetical protein